MSEIVVKSANQSRTSTTALAADSELTLALAPGDYWVQIGVRCAAGATPDIKYSLNFTGSLTWSNMLEVSRLDQRPWSDNIDVSNGPSRSGVWTEVNIAANSPLAIAGSDTASTHIGIIIRGVLRVSSSGSLQFLWAQNNSSLTAATVFAGSYIEAVLVTDLDETVVIKETTETRNSDAVLTDDDELLYALEANKKYIVSVGALFYAAATPDIDMALKVTGSPTTVIGTNTRTSIQATTTLNSVGTSQNWDAFFTTPTEILTPGTATAANRGGIHYDVGIIMGGSAGQVSLAWAQNVSDAGDTQVFRGSFLKILEVP